MPHLSGTTALHRRPNIQALCGGLCLTNYRAGVWSARAPVRHSFNDGGSAPLFLQFYPFRQSSLPAASICMDSPSPVPPREEPPAPGAFNLPTVRLVDLKSQLPPKDWPHAPVHRLAGNAVYFVTAGTLHKEHFFDTPEKRDLLERYLLAFAKEYGWQLEAWAVLANHYHFVARGSPNSRNLGEFLHDLHGVTSRELNKHDGVKNRRVWFNFRDTKLTIQYSYLARLNYVHQNAVRHKLVPVANQYPWCSAAWFERTASPAQVKTIYGFKTDRVKVEDDF
jgi:putative transposase